ncbi:MAG TPA: 30S ribosomal protein S4 [Clostridiaceae bacterium]|nr:30S ribosomal protein S4 [Clostridiaceae bacterium]
MARYTESSCRLCRREGEKLFLKGQRCYSNKCSVANRSYAPGQQGQGTARRKVSEYGLQLRAKQKTKRFYGLQETQFRNLFKKAARLEGVTGENFLRLLELRMDNVVYRMGFASSRAEARQLVTHGHFTVNGQKKNIPSAILQAGDVVEVKESSRKSAKFKELGKNTVIPNWLTFDPELLKGTIVSEPTRDEVDIEVEEHLIVELYSR